MATNFNIEPYFDDYNEDDKYLRILFRPAYPVQARELTQSQTILQNQISRLANTMYKQGDKVSGSVSFYGTYAYVKLQNFYGTSQVTSYIQNFVGQTIVGSVSNAQAIVLQATEATDTDPPTLFVSYNLTGTDSSDNKYETFTENEQITTQDDTITIYKAYTATQEATGFGTAVGITDSVFYINDFFVKVDKQTIILSKYNEQVTAGDFVIGNRYQIRSIGTTDFTACGADSNTVGLVFKATGAGVGTGIAIIGPSYRVGLTVQEDFITPQDDANLFDNAAGYSNYSAPGAHRYRIIAKLAKFPVDGINGTDIDGNAAVDTGFVEVLRVNNGELAYAVKTSVNSDVLEMMARRTFDESGNYTVKPFGIDVREHRNNYRGTWTKNTSYLIDDIVKNSFGNYYTARNSGISSSVEPTQAPPLFNSLSPTWNDAGGVGINWQYTDPNKIKANDGIFTPENGGDESKLSIGVEAGKAYVEGYEITKTVTTRIPVDKSRTTGQVLEGSISTLVGNYVLLKNLTGLPDLSTFPQVVLQNNYGHTVGTARIRSVELSSGSVGSTSALYKASLFDVQMDYGITDIEITNPGSGYTVAPTTTNGGIIIRDANNQNVTSNGGTDIQGILSGGTLVALNIVDPGSFPKNCTIEIAGGATAEIWVDTLEFNRVVKKLFYSGFTAEIYKEYNNLPGFTTYTGQGSSQPYKLTGENTLFTLLRPGDTILVSLIKDGAPATQEMTIGYVESDSVAYVYYPSTTPTDTFVGFNSKACKYQTSKIYESANSSLLFSVPQPSVKSIRAADGSTIDTILFVREVLGNVSVTTTGSNCTAIFSTTGEFETPNSPFDSDENYLVSLSNGKIITPSNIEFVGTQKNQVRITWTSSQGGTGLSAKLLATVIRSSVAAKESTKTLVSNAFNDRKTMYNVQADIIQLDKADIYRIVRITQGASAWEEPYDSSTEIDITDNYTLDDGQRDTHYDHGAIIRKPTASLPTGPIRIWFEYFDHVTLGSGSGSYFSADSYKSINYKDIPKYKGYPLSDYIDFRPRKLPPSWAGSEPLSSPSTPYTDSFGDTTYPVPSLPKRGYDMIASYSYYLNRRDVVHLDKTGTISIATGIPAAGSAAKYPDSVPANSMILYKIYYTRYTPDTTSNNVIVDTIDNRRYTMRDIGLLDKRISDLEEYTKLSLLERAAASTQIIDPNVAFGADRLKAGFIVDQFDGHKVGDVTSIDYRVSIDTINNELRPLYNIENINLVESATTEFQRKAKNYINHNDICMLPFSHKELVKQPFASRTENINPFAIFSFIGQLTMTPDTDEWVDIENIDLPPVVDTSELAAMTNIANNTYNPVTGKMGILGNYYGAWTQVATGVTRVDRGASYTVEDRSRPHYNGNANSGWYQSRHDEITARQLQAVRPMYTAEVKLIGNSTPVLTGDKVTATAIIPYIRSRPVVFVGKGIKPDTDLMGFFDNINVDEYIKPAAKLVYTQNGTTLFDDASPVGASSRETARTGVVDKNTAMAYSRGDVVYVSSRGGTTYSMDTSPGTAVVAFSELREENGRKTMHVVNLRGGFLNGDTIRGSVSGALGTAYSQTVPTKLTTNKSGQVAGVFTIPNNTRTSFRSGTRVFRLSDKESIAVSTTRAEKTYLASGVKETHTRSFSSTAHYEIATRELGTEKGGYTWVQDPTTRRAVADGAWYDPLAQTFLVQQEGGAMISKVDVYFKTKDASIPVRLEIRETDNGYPSKVIIPESVVTLDPISVNISEDASVATTFTFPSPVALKDKGEYALVLVSDSNSYNVWISKLGEEEVSTGRLIGEQPYAGVLFKSQNGSTWTAEQMEDLKFTIYRAQFATGVVANVELVNDVNPIQQLKTNPFEFTLGSRIVTVTQHNHGFFSGGDTSYVTLYVPEASTYAGIGASYFNNKHKVTTVIDRNTYQIELTSSPLASSSIIDGGNDEIFATRNIQYNEIHPTVNELLMPNTFIDYEIQAVSGKSSTDSSDVPYQFDEGFVDLIIGQNNFFETPRLVASAENELAGMTGKHSMTVRAKMYTTNDAVSPFLDLKRTSALVVENIIDTGNTGSPFYVDESEPHTGSATAKYLTKKVTLQTPATGLYVAYNANIPPASSISVYYRVGKSSEGYLFDLRPWLLALNEDIFLDSYKSDDIKAFPQITYTIDKTEGEYDVVQVKLVMRSTSSSAVPRVKDFTVIALA